MIASMTAFGRFEDSGGWGQATWEIRSVNHRYLEMFVRLPEELRILENTVREQISAKLGRGKIDCLLRYEPGAGSDNQININTALAHKLITAAAALPVTGPSSLNPLDILRWPGVIEKETLDPDILRQPILDALHTTLELIITARRHEGEKIQSMILVRCAAANSHVNHMRERLPQIAKGMRERYLQRAHEFNTALDHGRLEQEMLLLVQKMDVAEEMDRLQAHIDAVKQALQEDQPVGRRLDFLLQEMNREANTLGAKAAHVDVSNVAVELKVLIEQMREQIQNIE